MNNQNNNNSIKQFMPVYVIMSVITCFLGIFLKMYYDINMYEQLLKFSDNVNLWFVNWINTIKF